MLFWIVLTTICLTVAVMLCINRLFWKWVMSGVTEEEMIETIKTLEWAKKRDLEREKIQ